MQLKHYFLLIYKGGGVKGEPSLKGGEIQKRFRTAAHFLTFLNANVRRNTVKSFFERHNLSVISYVKKTYFCAL